MQSQLVSDETRVSEKLANGPVWAGILAAGIGCAALGTLVDLSEASKSISKALSFYTPTGDLAGKTILAIIVWIIAWSVLRARWKNRDVHSPKMVLTIALVFVLLAMVAVFPPFFEIFAAK
ncbi:MAG TPA: hypothetical protein VFW23_18020 [Tepidisphaeraceae bacterium]|nr:hypothetical protein [Tepidisphaeraceae bacterium]